MYTNIILLIKKQLSDPFLIAPEYTHEVPGLHKYNLSQHISLYGKIKIFKWCIYYIFKDWNKTRLGILVQTVSAALRRYLVSASLYRSLSGSPWIFLISYPLTPTFYLLGVFAVQKTLQIQQTKTTIECNNLILKASEVPYGMKTLQL